MCLTCGNNLCTGCHQVQAYNPPLFGAAVGATYFPSGTYYSSHDFELFQKYAHLDDGEVVAEFIKEHDKLVAEHKAYMETTIKQLKEQEDRTEKEFFDWCAKYKKAITKERVDNLKAFT